MIQKKRIFLVEDDTNFGSVLKAYLELNDFEVSWIEDGREALPAFKNQRFDICVLDVMLPHVDGFSIANGIRALKPEVPFVFLTAKTMREDLLKGFSVGADDYITKPFDSEVLVLKLNAILNRIGTGNNDPIELNKQLKIGKYDFDYSMRTLKIEKIFYKLSPRESDLLKLLYEYRNRILPRQLALKSIWGDDSYFTTRSMDVFISKLRKYLNKDEAIQIVNIHGNGFRMIIDSEKESFQAE